MIDSEKQDVSGRKHFSLIKNERDIKRYIYKVGFFESNFKVPKCIFAFFY